MNRILRNSFALIPLFTLTCPAWGEPLHTAAEARTPPVVTVWLYNYARVPHSLLAKAVASAEQVFRRAGIAVEWLEQPVSPPKYVQARSTGYLGPTDLFLRLLSKSQAKRIDSKLSVFGMAHMSNEDDYPTTASIFFHRIANLAKAQGLSEVPLLGHILAHEVGHLLLGRGCHANTGLMRCPWRKRELKKASWGRLWFSPEQVQRIHGQVRARMEARHLQLVEQQKAPGELVAKAATSSGGSL